MVDLIIGNNTYKDINAVKLRKTDGQLATFVEKSEANSGSYSPTAAFVSVVFGTSGIVADVGSAEIKNLPVPTAELKSIE